MRRTWLYIIGGLLVLAAITGIIMAAENSNDHSDKPSSANGSQNSSAVAFPKRQACNIFTLADAKKVLGDTAKGGDNGTTTSSDALSVSTCSYTQDSGSNVPV